MVPSPAKAKSYQKIAAARTRHTEAAALTDMNLMALTIPPEGTEALTVTATSAMPNQAMAPLWEVGNALIARRRKPTKKSPPSSASGTWPRASRSLTPSSN